MSEEFEDFALEAKPDNLSLLRRLEEALQQTEWQMRGNSESA